MTNPAVSVIIPVYNAEAHLAACIASVRGQTLEQIEILCVDDGSSDQSYAILEELAAQDGRMRVFRQQNSGAGAARNLALAQAKGEFISFLDADDRFAEADCLRLLYTAARKMNVAICGGFRQLLLLDGSITLHSFLRRELARKPQGVKISYSEFQCDYHYQNFLFQRVFLEQNRISFPLYRRFQDPPFLVRAMIKATEFGAVPVEVYLYRLREQPIEWDQETVCGLLRGLTDNLINSREAGLFKLHAQTVRRIEQDFLEPIVGQMHTQEVYDLCLRANSAVDFSRLNSRRKQADRNQLLPLRLRESGVQSIVRVNRSEPVRKGESSSVRFPVRGLLKCLREHGLRYTIMRGMEHFGVPMGAQLRKPDHAKRKHSRDELDLSEEMISEKIKDK